MSQAAARLWFVTSDFPAAGPPAAGPPAASAAAASAPAGGAAARFPWPAGSATGVGSMPGTDFAEACAVVQGELPDFAYLPELPGRGPGADMIGRTAALLVDLPVETTPGGWRFALRPGRDLRRATDYLAFDLDAAQQAADGYAGAYKIAVCGPLTLAARIEPASSVNPALADPGAVADVAASLAEGLAAHVAEVAARIPGASIVVQIDEPALPAVLAGHIPTASGLSVVPALDEPAIRAVLGPVLSAVPGVTVLHCCAQDYPFLLARDAGAAAVSFDLATVRRADLDAIAEITEAGLGLLIGAVPTGTAVAGEDDPARPGAPRPGTSRPGTSRAGTSRQGTSRQGMSQPGTPRQPRDTAASVVTLWRRMALGPALLAAQVVLTPACGLAGASPMAARAMLAHCREAARIAPELIEEGQA
jgi:hypothetical protein